MGDIASQVALFDLKQKERMQEMDYVAYSFDIHKMPAAVQRQVMRYMFEIQHYSMVQPLLQ